MIEPAAVREVTEQLRQIEDRLGRLLTSGWRQARAEAADLRQDAEALTEAGLPGLAARVAGVADASGPAEALQAIALATNACRLLRVRLPASAAPDGWAPLTPSRSARATHTEALVPVSRLLLDGRSVWVCTRSNRNELLLIDPPFPEEEPAQTSLPPPKGIFGRIGRQLGQAFGTETVSPSHWLYRRLAGTLRWQAQYPLGAQGDVGLWTLEDADWTTELEDQQGQPAVQSVPSAVRFQDGAPLFWTAGGFRIRELHRDETAAYVWLDPSAAAAFGAAPTEKVWAIVWNEGPAIVPVALLTPADKGTPIRLTHLIPGSPQSVLAAQG